MLQEQQWRVRTRRYNFSQTLLQEKENNLAAVKNVLCTNRPANHMNNICRDKKGKPPHLLWHEITRMLYCIKTVANSKDHQIMQSLVYLIMAVHTLEANTSLFVFLEITRS